MSTIGAYIELRPGEDPPFHSFSCWMEADFHGKTPNGLEVSWEPREDEIPASAQIYLAWEPRVYAVWNDEEEIEDGEDGEHEDDALTGFGDEEVAPELDEGSGSTGPLEVGGDEGSVGCEEVE